MPREGAFVNVDQFMLKECNGGGLYGADVEGICISMAYVTAPRTSGLIWGHHSERPNDNLFRNTDTLTDLDEKPW